MKVGDPRDRNRFEVAVVGAGFSGSLIAAILARAGRQVALIDPVAHPRFAIGESSTPVADLLLDQICERYQLEAIRPLARYGTWQRHHPSLGCGLKRGFSYFAHRPDRPFFDDSSHRHSLLVAANANDRVADTHWFRSDVDAFLAREAVAAGAYPIQAAVLAGQPTDAGIRLTVNATLPRNAPGDGDVQGERSAASIDCDFLVDASGFLLTAGETLGVRNRPGRLLNHTCATYAHLEDVGSWDGWLARQGCAVDDYPFPADHAAQHHLLANGWLWMLRFENQVTSVGWTRRWLPGDSTDPLSTPGKDRLVDRFGLTDYPDLQQLFQQARVVAPEQGPVMTRRLQRHASRMVGPNFAILPTAGITIDPLHSSGIAHGLSGVVRLADILLEEAGRSKSGLASRDVRLRHYEQSVFREAALLDGLVLGGYLAENWLPLFAAHAMFYFAAAIRCEERLAGGDDVATFWEADDQRLVEAVTESNRRIAWLRRQHRCPDQEEIAHHLEWTRRAVAPWNTVGLLDDRARNMYRYTTADKG